jgi:PIN domain nuclease of toxin-antitoxin system
LRLLLDSNVLLWSISDRNKLTPRVRQLIDDDRNELFVSRTSIWELSAKVAAGRLAMPGSTIQSLLDQIAIAGLTILELEDRFILRSETLPYHHSGPFDRILVAQALEEGLTILTSDSEIPLYAAPVIWK